MSKPITIKLMRGDLFDDVVLANVCAECDGKGVGDRVPDRPHYRYKCMGCYGTGYKLTDNGRAIIHLISTFNGTDLIPYTWPIDTHHGG